MTNSDSLVTDLSAIARRADENQENNEAFTRYLKQAGAAIDETVMALNAAIAPQINCLACGNCCKNLLIHVEQSDIPSLARRLDTTEAAFADRYLETGFNGSAIVSQVPCHFLDGNRCTVYEDRFSACRSFPHLDTPGISRRAFALMQQVGRCPIVYNVVEQLKLQVNFTGNESN